MQNKHYEEFQRCCIQILHLLGAVLLLPMISARMVTVTYVGHLRDTVHDIGGLVFILDQNNLVIDQFSYDGQGFGVNIFIAAHGRNLRGFEKNRVLVPYPARAGNQSIEGNFKGDGQMVIDVSQVGLRTKDIKWLSLWCTEYMISFGHVLF